MKTLQLISLTKEKGLRKLLGPSKKRILAEIWVDNGKVVIKSKYRKVKQDIEKLLQRFEEKKALFGYRTAKQTKTSVTHYFVPQKITDPDFLDAFADTTDMLGEKFGGYDWYPRIIEK